jgi:hypothetical protein
MHSKSKVKSQKSKVKSVSALKLCAGVDLVLPAHKPSARCTFDFCLLTFDF